MQQKVWIIVKFRAKYNTIYIFIINTFIYNIFSFFIEYPNGSLNSIYYNLRLCQWNTKPLMLRAITVHSFVMALIEIAVT